MQTALNFNGLTFPNQQATLTKQEKKLYNLLPVGKENAVQGSYLANILHINKRTVISIVRKLRLKHFDVGSTTNNGYYRFKTPKERIRGIHKNRSNGIYTPWSSFKSYGKYSNGSTNSHYI